MPRLAYCCKYCLDGKNPEKYKELPEPKLCTWCKKDGYVLKEVPTYKEVMDFKNGTW